MKIKAIKTSFNGGEISKQLFGRVDLESFVNSNKQLFNALPTIYGSVQKRGGTSFVASAKSKCLLIEFKVNKNINYILEFGDNYIRFYRNRQQILDSNNEIYEISSPYSLNDLFDEYGKCKLNWTQSVDVLYLCHKNYPIQTLKRYGDTNWVLEEFTLKGGPFDNVNPDVTKQLTSTGTEGLITVNAVYNSSRLSLTVGNGSVETYYNLPHTIWELDGEEIYRSSTFMSIDDAITQLLGTSDGQNFNITRNGNTINISVKSSSIVNYAGKVLTFKRREILQHTTSEFYQTRKYQDSATFSGAGSADVFEAEDVGKLLRIQYTDTNTVMWEASKSISIGNIRKSGNNYYTALTAGTTGTIKPIHTSGSVSDGGVVWKYLHSGYGVGTILEVVSASQIKLNVDGYFPDFSTATSLWEKGLVGKGGVYPNCCAFYKERFIFSISTSTGTKICASCAGDYNNFSDNDFGDVLDENAITVILQGRYESDVLWMISSSKLLIGTNSEEFIFGEQTMAEVLSPTNVQCISVSKLGSSQIKALEILDEMFFVSKDEKQVASLNYVAEKDTFRPVNISVMFEHLFVNGVKSWAFTASPYKTIFFADNTGKLKSISYDTDNKVCAGARHDVGGVIESVAVIPSANGNYDELWCVAKRNINDNEVRYIEVLNWGVPIDDVDNETKNKKQIFLDCSKTFESLTDVSSVNGLDHLEGKTVSVLVDGKIQSNKVVSDGSISLDSEGKIVVVGLNYEMVVETLYFNLGGTNGTSQGLAQRVNKLMVRCIDTRYVRAKASGGNQFDDIVNSDNLIDGDFKIELPSDYSKLMTITMVNDKPVNSCVLAIVADIGTY